MGLAPSEFWRATFHDFTCLLWARKVAAEPDKGRREMSGAEVVSFFSARAKRVS